jgi:hypothetical protein
VYVLRQNFPAAGWRWDTRWKTSSRLWNIVPSTTQQMTPHLLLKKKSRDFAFYLSLLFYLWISLQRLIFGGQDFE